VEKVSIAKKTAGKPQTTNGEGGLTSKVIKGRGECGGWFQSQERKNNKRKGR